METFFCTNINKKWNINKTTPDDKTNNLIIVCHLNENQILTNDDVTICYQYLINKNEPILNDISHVLEFQFQQFLYKLQEETSICLTLNDKTTSYDIPYHIDNHEEMKKFIEDEYINSFENHSELNLVSFLNEIKVEISNKISDKHFINNYINGIILSGISGNLNECVTNISNIDTILSTIQIYEGPTIMKIAIKCAIVCYSLHKTSLINKQINQLKDLTLNKIWSNDNKIGTVEYI